MNDLILQIVVGIAVPAFAIIISTWVAVGLAKAERRDAVAARADERIDDAFVRSLVALATLNTMNLRVEAIAEPFRELRVGLTLLAAVSPRQDNDLLSKWFEAERVAGLAQSNRSMRNLALAPKDPSSQADVDAVVSAGAPLNTWARDFANNLRLWRRDGATDDRLAELVLNASTLH